MLQPAPLILQHIRTYAKKTRKLLGVYDCLPCELFRINGGVNVILRDFETQRSKGRSAFDVVLDSNGLVQPSAGNHFLGPNGMSLRPNGPFLQEIIRTFRNDNTVIYRLPKGLEVKSRQLKLLWEHTDHHSLQTTVPIELDALNEKLTALCLEAAEKMTREEFEKRYPFDDCI
ncbi:hypothetical protein HA402_003006 [Bradysia odoriphaga]|nr:hypothetical protein HA402_003006 [Bradysia odoriphaga]